MERETNGHWAGHSWGVQATAPWLLLLAAMGCSDSTSEGSSSCAEPEISCSGHCVDPLTDPLHCGSCEAACPAGQVCSAGQCSCPSGQTSCGGQCVDTSTSLTHCGACDVACAAGETCIAGQCVDGTEGTGGSVSSGGTGTGASSGGSSSAGALTGGASTGGTSSGGRAAGGALTGGTASGGVSGHTGGAVLGGTASGGSSLGGARTGGTTAGGAPTGGVGSGGAPTGATGGVATGGDAAGAAATGGEGTGGVPVTFRNPLNESFGSDPWMIYCDGYYYLSATTWDNDNLTMKRGRTIQELKETTPELIWKPGPGDGARSRAMWAPEFYLLDNGQGEERWYFYFTAGDGSPDFVGQRSHVLESAGLDPMGPYTFRATLLDYWAIDGSILQVNGSLHFMFSAWEGGTQNVYLQAMSNPWTLTGDRIRLTRPDYAWEKEGSDQVNEGPEPLYHEGRTFVSYSASQCASPGYKLGLLELTGDDPMNPGSWWKSSQPVFQAANGNYSTAHNGFFLSPDGTEHWLVYHGVSNAAGSCWTDRTTRVQPFTWKADGTPDFGEPLPLTADIVVPSGE